MWLAGRYDTRDSRATVPKICAVVNGRRKPIPCTRKLSAAGKRLSPTDPPSVWCQKLSDCWNWLNWGYNTTILDFRSAVKLSDDFKMLGTLIQCLFDCFIACTQDTKWSHQCIKRCWLSCGNLLPNESCYFCPYRRFARHDGTWWQLKCFKCLTKFQT